MVLPADKLFSKKQLGQDFQVLNNPHGELNVGSLYILFVGSLVIPRVAYPLRIAVAVANPAGLIVPST